MPGIGVEEIFIISPYFSYKYTFYCFNMVREKKGLVSLTVWIDKNLPSIHSPPTSLSPSPLPLTSAIPLILTNKILGEYWDF